jgi:hypothetical protein
MSLIETLKAERTKLAAALTDFKPDNARITALRAEIAVLSGSALKSELVTLDRTIKNLENPGRATRPMSEAGKLAIKAGLANYHAKRKEAASAASGAPQTASPAIPSVTAPGKKRTPTPATKSSKTTGV